MTVLDATGQLLCPRTCDDERRYLALEDDQDASREISVRDRTHLVLPGELVALHLAGPAAPIAMA